MLGVTTSFSAIRFVTGELTRADGDTGSASMGAIVASIVASICPAVSALMAGSATVSFG